MPAFLAYVGGRQPVRASIVAAPTCFGALDRHFHRHVYVVQQHAGADSLYAPAPLGSAFGTPGVPVEYDVVADCQHLLCDRPDEFLAVIGQCGVRVLVEVQAVQVQHPGIQTEPDRGALEASCRAYVDFPAPATPQIRCTVGRR